VRVKERWRLPSARWIAERIAFAPGMAAMVDALGSDRARVLDTFVAALERDQGDGAVTLSAIAHIGMVQKPVLRQGEHDLVRIRAKRDARAGPT
jgi:hypothetical protein